MKVVLPCWKRFTTPLPRVFTIRELKSFSETYRRIGRELFGMSSLWLADDHLVYVKGTGFLMPFLEEYKRFRLSDIEAITLARTSRFGKGILYLTGLLLNVGIAALIFALSDILRSITVAAISFCVAGGLVFLALLVRHLILGPTCVCDVQTSLTRERLRPLNRYHRTLQAVALIEHLVREKQAGLSGASAGGPTSATIESRSTDSFYGGTFQVPLLVPPAFCVFLALGLAGLAGLHLESVLLTACVLLMILLGSLMITMTLVAVIRKATPDSLRMVLWIAMGIHFLVVGAGAVYFLTAATAEPAYTVGLAGPLEAFTGIATNGGAVFYTTFMVLFLAYFITGLIGLIEVGKWQRRLRLGVALEAGDYRPTGDEGGERNE